MDEGTLNFSLISGEEMVRRGDGTKALWGSNFGWNHLPDDWTGPPSIWGSASVEQRAAYTRDAYRRAREEWPWTGGLILQHWDPDAPPDDPLHGFAVAPVIDDWVEQGVLPAQDGLVPGLHPADNAYTTYSENWQLSDLGADAVIPNPESVTPEQENRITVRFEGNEFAIPLRRDDYMAYLYVTVDGEPANALPENREGEAFILLTSPSREPEIDLIAVARGLDDGPHTVEIVHRPYNGDDRWPIAGYAVGSPPDTAGYDRARLISAAMVGAWRCWARRPDPAAVAARAAAFAGTLRGAAVADRAGDVAAGAGGRAALTWERRSLRCWRDPPALAITILTAGVASLSPVFVVTLAALAVLSVLIYNRPVLGLMLIIFWSAFFMSTLDLLFRLFATVEVYLAITVAAVAGRALVEWARRRRSGAAPARLRVRLTGLDWAVLGFVAVGVLSLAWAEYRSTATRELRVVILEPAAFYALLRVMRLGRRDVLWLVDAVLVTGGAIAVVGLALFVTGESVVEAEEGARRLISVYGSPNGVGLYLGRCLPFAFAFTVHRSAAGGASRGGVVCKACCWARPRRDPWLPAALVVMILLWQGRRSLVPSGYVLGIIVALIRCRSCCRACRTSWYGVLPRTLVQSVNSSAAPADRCGAGSVPVQYRSRYLLPEMVTNLSIPQHSAQPLGQPGDPGMLAAAALQGFLAPGLRTYRRLPRGPDGAGLVIALAGGSGFLAHGLVDVAYTDQPRVPSFSLRWRTGRMSVATIGWRMDLLNGVTVGWPRATSPSGHRAIVMRPTRG